MAAPLFSIITINFNQAMTLAQTMDSVLAQDFGEFEYIVIDGASTDGSLELIKARVHGLAHWRSEPDKGIADAMNKGLALATGRYVLFLHSDDYLLSPRSLSDIAGRIDERDDIYAFDILYGSPDRHVQLSARGFGPWFNFKTGIYHQAAWCRREAFSRIGGFDASFRIAMDYDWFLRAYRAGLTCRRCPAVFSLMRDTGLSAQTDPAALSRRLGEERKAHELHCNSGLLSLLYAAYWRLYPRYRGIRLPAA